MKICDFWHLLGEPFDSLWKVHFQDTHPIPRSAAWLCFFLGTSADQTAEGSLRRFGGFFRRELFSSTVRLQEPPNRTDDGNPIAIFPGLKKALRQKIVCWKSPKDFQDKGALKHVASFFFRLKSPNLLGNHPYWLNPQQFGVTCWN